MKTELNTTETDASRTAALVGSGGGFGVLWSQAFADDYYHAIPAADHDPHASGWIAHCGAFCCGEPFRAEDEQGREACPRCIRPLPPNTKFRDAGGHSPALRTDDQPHSL